MYLLNSNQLSLFKRKAYERHSKTKNEVNTIRKNNVFIKFI